MIDSPKPLGSYPVRPSHRLGPLATTALASGSIGFSPPTPAPPPPVNGAVVKVVARIGDAERTFKGRVAWCLHRLATAGEHGVTPIEYPAPRWSDYVFKLRKSGVTVETIDEKHGGAYAGLHAKYVLRTPLEIIATETAP